MQASDLAKFDIGQRWAWDLVADQETVSLCGISDGDTWLRPAMSMQCSNRLTDDGYLRDSNRVVFYGAVPGLCGGCFLGRLARCGRAVRATASTLDRA